MFLLPVLINPASDTNSDAIINTIIKTLEYNAKVYLLCISFNT